MSTKVSRLEDVLLRLGEPGGFRDQLFNELDDGATLRRLRATSRVLRDLVKHKPGRLFRTLYLKANLSEMGPIDMLEVVMPFCHNLTITARAQRAPQTRPNRLSGLSFSGAISNGLHRVTRRRDTARSSRYSWRAPDDHRSINPITARMSIAPLQVPQAQADAQEDCKKAWLNILSRCHQLRLFTLRIHGDPAWPGRTEIVDSLITIRCALEQSALPNLTEVRFAPLHAMGLIHLRWSGLGVFGSAAPIPNDLLGPGRTIIWHRLHTLDLQLLNPFATGLLTPAQELMFKKLLYQYLRSFTTTLRCLRFVWLDAAGPSPLTLHLEEDIVAASSSADEQRQPLKWPALEELRVGNMTHPHRTINLAAELAPKLDRLWTLRTTYWTESMDLQDPEAWVDISLVTKQEAEPSSLPRMGRPASSVYSQSARSSVTELAGGGGVSRMSMTSRVVPFFLDITGRRTRARTEQQ